jgi:hypothetical protein
LRAALLVAAIVLAVGVAPFTAQATFSCFVTAQGEPKCACIGGADCIALQKSGDCKTRFKCDDSELGALVCSCKANRSSKID